MTCYIIVAIYYERYLSKVLEQINATFKTFNPHIVLVNNNPKEIDGAKSHNTCIRGSNAAGEFSAWDEGVAHVVSNFTIKDDDVFIFLNDTFCHHRIFTSIDRYVYRKSIITMQDNIIRGEFNQSTEALKIYDTTLKGWISSYFFCCRWQSVKRLQPFSKAARLDPEVKIKIQNDLRNRTVEIPFFSSGLNTHLTKWLFPAGSRGWHGKSKDINDGMMFFKLQAILNEKLLSYTAVTESINVEGIYETWFLNHYNFYRYKTYNFIRKLKLFCKSRFHK